MKLTVEEADEIVSLVCDRLCAKPGEYTEDELEDECDACPLVERLLREVNKHD